jgi:hypothetical protein
MTNVRGTPRLLGVSMLAMLYAGTASAQQSSAPNLLATTRQAPDEFGTSNYTVTMIGAGSFTPASDDNSTSPVYYTVPSRAFVRGITLNADQHFYATVSIPSGAVIDNVGLESYCTAPGLAGVALTLIDRYGTTTPIAAFSCTQHGMDSDYVASPIGFQLVRNVHNLLLIDVELNDGATNFGQFSWVEIWWKRTVSPAPATATFSDVPPSSPQFKFVEALHAAGITAGCGGGNYCPDSPITRGQMAVFLATALGLHWPY